MYFCSVFAEGPQGITLIGIESSTVSLLHDYFPRKLPCEPHLCFILENLVYTMTAAAAGMWSNKRLNQQTNSSARVL